MNQRVRRKSKKNNADQIVVGSSAHPARQSTDRSPAEVVVPQRATGDVKPEAKKGLGERLAGLAKASPLYKAVTPKEVASADEQKRALAENTVEKDKTQEEKQEDAE